MDFKALEAKAENVIGKIVAGIHAVLDNPTVQEIEAKWPAAAKLAADVTTALRFVHPAQITLHALVTYGPLFYAFAQAADLKPADQAFFDELEKNRGSQE